MIERLHKPFPRKFSIRGGEKKKYDPTRSIIHTEKVEYLERRFYRPFDAIIPLIRDFFSTHALRPDSLDRLAPVAFIYATGGRAVSENLHVN